nr:Shedu anti-phage system protein SduA domain-containing protein [Parapedobacter lycopersici]
MYLSEKQQSKEDIAKIFLEDYIESPEDIWPFFDIDSLTIFLRGTVIVKQKHLDFIVAEIETDRFYSRFLDLAGWIRQTEATYSSNNFRLNAIPIFVIKKDELGKDQLIERLLTDETQRRIDEEKIYRLENLLEGRIIKPADGGRLGVRFGVLPSNLDTWLDRLQSDLDTVEIDPISGRFGDNLSMILRQSHRLKILSEKFVQNVRKMDYIWIGNKGNIIESVGDEFTALLKKSENNPTLRNEKALHDFLRKNEHLLKSEKFVGSIYEHHFYHQNSRRYEEVDLINVTQTYTLGNIELFEVKLPNQRFFYKRNRNPLKVAKKYFQQIGLQYHSYFSDPKNFQEIQRGFRKHGYSIENQDFDFTLLMGRDYDKPEFQELMEYFYPNLATQVRLITYDSLIRKHEFLFNRIRRFGIN